MTDADRSLWQQTRAWEAARVGLMFSRAAVEMLHKGRDEDAALLVYVGRKTIARVLRCLPPWQERVPP